MIGKVLGVIGALLVLAGLGWLFVTWLVGPNDVNKLQPW